ncbi:hypothetical protein COB52_00545 [Candidatus Kaiserbacteria bacterium]|nr:MAG: hypothetical protein COB52_00545 [Candidatus Kaiserbacteria bacterium]
MRPPFKDKFRPSEAKELIEKIVEDRLKNQTYLTDQVSNWTKEIADEVKQKLKTL